MESKLIINKKFIKDWEAEYCNIEKDDKRYRDLIKKVKEEIKKNGTISKETFMDIYKWKSSRSIHYVKDESFSKYKNSIKKVLQVKDEKEKISILKELPGIGIPVASTILHFIYPKTFPIVDFRTIETLQKAQRLEKTKSVYHYRDTINGYFDFKNTIMSIAKENQHSIRQIDRALFAYHKKTNL